MALLFPQCTPSLAHLAYPNKGNHFLVCGGQMRLGNFSKKGNNLIRCDSTPTKSVNLEAWNIFHDDHEMKRQYFPADFKFGASTSALQSEGPPTLAGRGPAGWDSILEDKAAALSYYKYKDDVKLLEDMGMNVYRFSISWSRILPNGKKDYINEKGIKFYNRLIDELLSNGIEPFVTLLHFDVPEALQQEYKGFVSSNIVEDFKNYCEICFQCFGDRVKYWTTINEPDVFTQFGYYKGFVAEDEVIHDNPTTNPYSVAHNIIMAHATVYRLYEEKYKATQNGKIGVSVSLIWFVPFSDSPDDKAAAERGLAFHTGLFLEPFVKGDYPSVIKKLAGDRLIQFTGDDKKKIKGAFDFVGANYYTSQYARALPPIDLNDVPISFSRDQCLEATAARDGVPLGENLVDNIYMVPEGLKKGLIYLKENYDNDRNNRLLIYITENGVVDDSELPSATFDNYRIVFIIQHLKAILEAMKEDVQVKGYIHWSLIDVVEMGGGYNTRMGLNHTNYDNWDRIPKNSAHWFSKFLKPTHPTVKPTPLTAGTVQV